jgi:hypothetical protein
MVVARFPAAEQRTNEYLSFFLPSSSSSSSSSSFLSFFFFHSFIHSLFHVEADLSGGSFVARSGGRRPLGSRQSACSLPGAPACLSVAPRGAP